MLGCLGWGVLLLKVQEQTLPNLQVKQSFYQMLSKAITKY